MKKNIFVIIFLVFIFSLFGEINQDLENLNNKLRSAKDKEEVNRIIIDAVLELKEIESLRKIQDYWEQISPEDCYSFFKNKYEKEKKSVVYTYLLGRITNDYKEQYKLAKRAIKLDSSFLYGYRLLAYCYDRYLFRSLPKSGSHDFYKENFNKDEKLLLDFYEFDTNDIFAQQFIVSFYVYKNNLDYANDFLIKLEKNPSANIYFNDILGYYAVLDKNVELRKKINFLIDDLMKKGQLKESERMEYYDWYLANVYLNVFKFDKARRVIMQDKGYQRKPEKMIFLAQINCREFDYKTAIKNISKAIDVGYSSLLGLTSNGDFIALQKEKDWDNIIQKIKVKRKETEKERKKEVLKNVVKIKAPKWELEDEKGNGVSLDSLKGKIIILDFWATWCSPCKKAMPVISEFYNNKNKQIKVFSINVWENNKEKVMAFMKDNNYKMKLLFGDKKLTDEYKIKGIPYICVIDQDGYIRFIEEGYNENLKENLNWWTQYLLK